MTSGICAVCGTPARYLFAFPSGASVASASAGVVYDGAPVCSPECARELIKQRERGASADNSGTSDPGEAREEEELSEYAAYIRADSRFPAELADAMANAQVKWARERRQRGRMIPVDATPDTGAQPQQMTDDDGRLYCPNYACDVREIPIEEAAHASATGLFYCPKCDTLLETPPASDPGRSIEEGEEEGE